LLTVKSSAGTVVYQKQYELEDNSFTFELHNSDTDTLSPGAYSYDVRYIINPYYNTAGKIVDGDQVLTPNLPMTLNLLNVVGEV